MGAKKDFDALKTEAKSQGWRIDDGDKKPHVRWYPPQGPFIISAKTPSDQRAFKNHISLMRRSGFVYKGH